MQRPDLTTLACVNPACQRFRLPGQDQLSGRTVSGQDRLRLLRCRTCGEECSTRRGTALCNTKSTEAQAASILHHVDAGGGGRAPARLVHVAQATVTRLLRTAGRHAERGHDQGGRDVTPRAWEGDAQWRVVQNSSNPVRRMSVRRLGPGGSIPRLPPLVSWSSPWSSANAPKRSR